MNDYLNTVVIHASDVAVGDEVIIEVDDSVEMDEVKVVRTKGNGRLAIVFEGGGRLTVLPGTEVLVAA